MRWRRILVVVIVVLLAAIAGYWVYISQQETESATGFPPTADRTVMLSSEVEYTRPCPVNGGSPDLGARS